MQQINRKFHRIGPRPLASHMAGAWHYSLKSIRPDYFYDYLQGVQQYLSAPSAQQRPYHFLTPNLKIKEGGLATDRPVVLLIPSLINGPEIFDIVQDFSFYDYLWSQGLQPVILDWGDHYAPALDSYIEDILLPAMGHFNGRKLALFGYCMAGLLALAAAQKSDRGDLPLILAATPWDFHAGAAQTLQKTRNLYHSVDKIVHGSGHAFLPIDILQHYFASIDPDFTAQKYIDFAQEKNETYRSLFVAVEDWLNTGRKINLLLFQKTLKDWYIDNLPAQNKWDIGGQFLRADGLKNPALIITPEKDMLVSSVSAKALQKGMLHADLLAPETGHIGLMASRRAKTVSWDPIVRWIKNAITQ